MDSEPSEWTTLTVLVVMARLRSMVIFWTSTWSTPAYRASMPSGPSRAIPPVHISCAAAGSSVTSSKYCSVRSPIACGFVGVTGCGPTVIRTGSGAVPVVDPIDSSSVVDEDEFADDSDPGADEEPNGAASSVRRVVSGRECEDGDDVSDDGVRSVSVARVVS